jgi:hypothetical protein
LADYAGRREEVLFRLVISRRFFFSQFYFALFLRPPNLVKFTGRQGFPRSKLDTRVSSQVGGDAGESRLALKNFSELLAKLLIFRGGKI